MAARDAQRAFEAWRGERTVWLLPEIKEPVRWLEEPDNGRSAVLAVPSEHIERVDVTHVGENGYMAGLGSMEGLLKTFVQTAEFPVFPGPDKIPMQIPRIDGTKVTYAPAHVHCRPASTMPITSQNDESGVVRVAWPPKGRPTPSISIDGESDEHYGPLDLSVIDGVRVASSRVDANLRASYTIFAWPDAINQLFPFGGGGADALLHQEFMSAVVGRASKDANAAIAEARTKAASYLSLGRASRAEACFAPLVEEVGADQAVVRANLSTTKPPRNFAEACKSRRWAKWMNEEVAVTRAWGPIGLFWALLIDALESGHSLSFCIRCGRPITGIRGKAFCNAKENPVCYRARRARDQRKCRGGQP